MPALLRVQLRASAAVPPRHLLGAAAVICEDEDADHHAAVKSFAVGPLASSPAVGGDGSCWWTIGWLAAAGVPPGWPPTTVRFGPKVCPVVGFDGRVSTYAELAAGPPARRVRLTTASPLFFSRNGRDLPLPEPVLIVRGLLARWNAFAPEVLRVGDEDAAALVGAVFLDEMTGTTRRTDIGPGLRQVGFEGRAELRLLRTASAQTCQVFAALARFAEFAGVGAQTTAGFGRVTVDLDPRAVSAEQTLPVDRRPTARAGGGPGAG